MCSAASGTCVLRAKPMAAPISSEIAWANNSARSRIRAWTRSRSKALLWAELTDQVANARRAAATAAATSLASAQRDLRDRLLGRWVDDGGSGLRCGHDPLAVDEHAIQAASAPEAFDDGGVQWSRSEVGPLDVQKLRLRAPCAGAAMRVLHKAGCGCASRYSRSCCRASPRMAHRRRLPARATTGTWAPRRCPTCSREDGDACGSCMRSWRPQDH